MDRFVKCFCLVAITTLLVVAYSPTTEAAKWTYHADFCNGWLTVEATINCVPIEPPILTGYVLACHEYTGDVWPQANDLRTIFEWDWICGNKDTTKYAVPYWDIDKWELEPLADWLDAQPDPLVLPVIGDSTGITQIINVVIDLSVWAADPRTLLDTYVVVDGECDDLPGYLIGTTPIVFTPDSASAFSTTPYTGILFRHAETTFCCYYTAVELARFEATARGRVVDITWSTESETDCAGFHIYRSRSKDGDHSKISQDMIACRGEEVKGADYSFRDRNVASGATYYYWLEDVALDGTATMHEPVSVRVDGIVSRPVRLFLAQNRPNPFSAKTEIEYGLPAAGNVRLTVFNLMGQHVKTLVDEYQPAGYRAASWDGTDDLGSPVSSGVYYYRVEADRHIETRKMVYMK